MYLPVTIIAEGEPTAEKIFSGGQPTDKQKMRSGLPVWKIPASVGISGEKSPIAHIKVTCAEKPRFIYGTTLVIRDLKFGFYQGKPWIIGDFDQKATDTYSRQKAGIAPVTDDE